MNNTGTELHFAQYTGEYLQRENPHCDVLKLNRMKCGRPAIAQVSEITSDIMTQVDMQGVNICLSHLTIAKRFAQNYNTTVVEDDENDEPIYAYANYY